MAEARARVEAGSDLESRVTMTRLVALGIFAFGAKKKRGGESFLTVEGPDFFWAVEVGPKQKAEAFRFAAAVNDAAAKSASGVALDLIADLSGTVGGKMRDVRLFADRVELAGSFLGVVKEKRPVSGPLSIEANGKVVKLRLGDETLEIEASGARPARKFVEKVTAFIAQS